LTQLTSTQRANFSSVGQTNTKQLSLESRFQHMFCPTRQLFGHCFLDAMHSGLQSLTVSLVIHQSTRSHQ